MRTRSLILVAASAAALTTPVAATAAKTKPALVLKRVTEPPANTTAGGTFIVQAKVKNLGEKTGSGVLKMDLVGGKKPYGVPRRVARIPVSNVKGLTFKRYKIRLTVPLNQGAGSYRLRTCLKARGAEECVTSSRRITVRAA